MYSITEFKGKVHVSFVKVLSQYSNKRVNAFSFMDTVDFEHISSISIVNF